MRTFTDQQCPVIEVAIWMAVLGTQVPAGLVPATAGGQGQRDGDDRAERDAQAPDSVNERMSHVTVGSGSADWAPDDPRRRDPEAIACDGPGTIRTFVLPRHGSWVLVVRRIRAARRVEAARTR